MFNCLGRWKKKPDFVVYAQVLRLVVHEKPAPSDAIHLAINQTTVRHCAMCFSEKKSVKCAFGESSSVHMYAWNLKVLENMMDDEKANASVKMSSMEQSLSSHS